MGIRAASDGRVILSSDSNPDEQSNVFSDMDGDDANWRFDAAE